MDQKSAKMTLWTATEKMGVGVGGGGGGCVVGGGGEQGSIWSKGKSDNGG